jgi:hypothetical protein
MLGTVEIGGNYRYESFGAPSPLVIIEIVCMDTSNTKDGAIGKQLNASRQLSLSASLPSPGPQPLDRRPWFWHCPQEQFPSLFVIPPIIDSTPPTTPPSRYLRRRASTNDSTKSSTVSMVVLALSQWSTDCTCLVGRPTTKRPSCAYRILVSCAFNYSCFLVDM